VDTLKQVSEYYEITYADIIKAFIDSRLPFNDITEDGRKPNEQGYSIYVNTIFDLIKSNINSKREPGFDGKKPLLYEESNAFENGKITTEFLTILFMKSSHSNDSITYEVSNSHMLGVTLMAGPNCGIVDIYLNNRLIQTYDGTHKIRIEVSSIKNAKASNSNVYIHGIITN